MSDTATSTPPPSPVGALAAQARALWAKLPARARLAAVASVVAIVGLVGYLAMSGGAGSWKRVTEGLSPSDARELIAALDQRGIPHRMPKPTVVEVPADKLYEAKAAATVTGVPRNGGGLEMFDKSDPMATSQQERVRYQRALQNELAHQISTLGPIERAEVNITFGSERVFKDEAQPAKASVKITLRPGMKLEPSQVQGIKGTVANAVPGLDPERVLVIDQNAVPLSSEAHHAGDEAATVEDQLAAGVRKVLEPVVGIGKVVVVAKVTLDQRKVQQVITDVGGPEAIAIVRTGPGASTGTTATAPPSGITGTGGNLPGTAPPTTAAAGAATPGAPLGAGESSSVNNELDRTVTQIEEPSNRIAKVSLAVLLAEGVDDNGDPAPRSPEQLKQINALARTAASIDDKRGDTVAIESMPFAPPEVAAMAPAPRGKLPVPLPVALGGAALLVVGAVLALRRRKKKPVDDPAAKIALPAPVAELERVLDAPGTADGEAGTAAALPPGKSLEERVIGAVKADVPRAARVLASWLVEPDPPPPPSHGKGARA